MSSFKTETTAATFDPSGDLVIFAARIKAADLPAFRSWLLTQMEQRAGAAEAENAPV